MGEDAEALLTVAADGTVAPSSPDKENRPSIPLRLALRCGAALLGAAVVACAVAVRSGTLVNTVGLLRHGDQALSSIASKFADDSCGGCPRELDKCVVVDSDHQQCINCDEEGNWKYECEYFDPKLRLKAVHACGLPCGDLKPPRSSKIRLTHCSGSSMEPDYASRRCTKERDGSFKVRCDGRSANECGVQLSSSRHSGAGSYSVAMQAAYGPGIASSVLLYSFGHDKDRSRPWNEISFDVLGAECYDDSTRISTSFVAGDFDEGAPYWRREPEHREYIEVPFDACDDWHKYEIEVSLESIKWKVDHKVYRTEYIDDYRDLASTVHSKGFQLRLAVVGQDESNGVGGDAGWHDMGYLEDSGEHFPVSTWYANIHIPA